MLDTMECVMIKEKATENMIMFREKPAPGKPPIIGRLYIQKWAIGDNAQIRVQVTPQAS